MASASERDLAISLLEDETSEQSIKETIMEKHLELHGNTVKDEFNVERYSEDSWRNAEEAAQEAFEEAKQIFANRKENWSIEKLLQRKQEIEQRRAILSIASDKLEKEDSSLAKEAWEINDALFEKEYTSPLNSSLN